MISCWILVLWGSGSLVQASARFLASGGRDESASTLEEFRKKEEEEMEGERTGQQLSACMAMADLLVINDGTLEELNRKLEDLT